MSSRTHQDIAAADIIWRDGVGGPGIKYTRFSMDDEDSSSPSIVISKFEAGSTVPPHTHDTNYFEYIIEGEQTVGKTIFGQGDVRIVKGGTGYGPIKVGPEGCTVLIVFQNGAQSIMEMLPRKKELV